MNKERIVLKKEEEMVFTLLKTVLNGTFDEEDAKTLTNIPDNEWMKCIKTAHSFGVLSLACHALTLLPREELMPSRPIKMKCIKLLCKAENTHKTYCKVISELEKLFEQEGIGMMVMKGVGISAYYPIPSLRRCGDIDIFTYSLDLTQMSDQEASNKSDEIIRQQGIAVDTHYYKHSSYKYKGIEIENHKFFLPVQEISEISSIDHVLRKVMKPRVYTFYDEYKIHIPSPEFNAIFIAAHASQHLGDALSVYQIFDWACILKKYGMIVPKEVDNKGFLQFIDCITTLTNQFLGTDVKVERHKQTENIILNDMLRYPFKGKVVPKNIFGWIKFRTDYNLYKFGIINRIYHVSFAGYMKRCFVDHWNKYVKKDR